MKKQVIHSISRRKFLKVVGAGAAASGLAACVPPPAAQPAAPAAQPAAATAGAAVQLQFWDMVWGPPEYIDTAKKIVDKWNAANPSIQVTYQSTPWSSWPQVFTTAIGSGTAPDLSTGGGFQPITFYESDSILPTDDMMNDIGIDDFPGAMKTAFNYDGHTLAIPWNLDQRATFYRTDMYEKAGVGVPKTWDDLRAALKKLTVDKQYGIAFAGNSPLGSQQMWQFAHNNGGGIFDKDKKFDVMNDRNLEAMEFVASLVKDGVVHPASAGWSHDDLAKGWAENTIATTTWGFGFDKRDPKTAEVSQVLPPLTGPHGDKGGLVFLNGIMMYKQTKHPKETMAFFTWWSKNSLALWTDGNCGVLPARSSFAKDAYFQKSKQTGAILNDYVPISTGLGTRSSGIAPIFGKVDGSTILVTLATDILQGMAAKEALQKAADEFAKLK